MRWASTSPPPSGRAWSIPRAVAARVSPSRSGIPARRGASAPTTRPEIDAIAGERHATAGAPRLARAGARRELRATRRPRPRHRARARRHGAERGRNRLIDEGALPNLKRLREGRASGLLLRSVQSARARLRLAATNIVRSLGTLSVDAGREQMPAPIA